MSIHNKYAVLQRLWRDTRGNMAPVDLILMTAITAIGVMVGLVIVRDGVVQEMGDVAVALESLPGLGPDVAARLREVRAEKPAAVRIM